MIYKCKTSLFVFLLKVFWTDSYFSLNVRGLNVFLQSLQWGKIQTFYLEFIRISKTV